MPARGEHVVVSWVRPPGGGKPSDRTTFSQFSRDVFWSIRQPGVSRSTRAELNPGPPTRSLNLRLVSGLPHRGPLLLQNHSGDTRQCDILPRNEGLTVTLVYGRGSGIRRVSFPTIKTYYHTLIRAIAHLNSTSVYGRLSHQDH